MKAISQIALSNLTRRGATRTTPLSERLYVTAANSALVNVTNNQQLRRRFIASDSWAASAAKATGEAIEPATPKPDVVFDEESIKNPSENVKKLCDQILTLNVVEVHQLLNLLQVR